jgi:hypothetical protein
MRTLFLIGIILGVFIFINTVHAVSALDEKVQRCNQVNGTVTYVYGSNGEVIDILCTDSKNNEVH